jgi:hypothetical protein
LDAKCELVTHHDRRHERHWHQQHHHGTNGHGNTDENIAGSGSGVEVVDASVD